MADTACYIGCMTSISRALALELALPLRVR